MCCSTKVGTFQSNNPLEFSILNTVKSSSITRVSVIHYVHAHAYIAWYPAQRDEANVWEHNSVAQGAANQLAIPIQCYRYRAIAMTSYKLRNFNERPFWCTA